MLAARERRVSTTGMATHFRFTGDIDGAEFLAFVAARAARLSLDGWARGEGAAVDCAVDGPADLVDAFEMACLLGPPRSLVLGCERRDEDAALGPGFRLRGRAA